MTATRAQIEEYARQTSLVSEAAQREMEAAYGRIAAALESGAIDQETAEGLLSDTLLSVSNKYGAVSSALASELYQRLLYEGTGEEREIPMADAATEEDADSAMSEVLHGAGSLLAALLGKTDQLVKQAGRDTMANAIAADADSGVKWARVPVGPTCAFCTMLASRGFVYESETSAGGNGNLYHANCDCQIIASWDDDPTVDGYDPDALYAGYAEARALVSEDAYDTWQGMSDEGKADYSSYNDYLTKRTLSAMRSLDSSLSDAHVGA